MKARNLNVLWMVWLLSACAIFGLPKPENVTERMVIAYSTLTAVRNSATNSLNVGDLSSADATQVLELTDEAGNILDSARSALDGGDTSTADGKINLATNILVELQAWLRRDR